jgi:hypothetical protein
MDDDTFEEEVESSSVQDDWYAIAPTQLMRRVALSVLSLGVFSSLLSLQLSWKVEGLTGRAIALLLFGVALLAIGRWVQVRVSSRSVTSAAVLSAMMLYASVVWLVTLLLDGWRSMLAIALVPHAMFTTALCVYAIDFARRTDAARARLRARGFEA